MPSSVLACNTTCRQRHPRIQYETISNACAGHGAADGPAAACECSCGRRRGGEYEREISRAGGCCEDELDCLVLCCVF